MTLLLFHFSKTPGNNDLFMDFQGANLPPKNLLKEVHKQAETKRALKMYSVISDGDDVRSRTPSPSDHIDPVNMGIIGSTERFENSFKMRSRALPYE